MNYSEAKRIMQIEKECVLRQDTPKCNRDSCGCQCCDLIQETEDVIKAYNIVITILDHYEQMTNGILKSIENMQLDPMLNHEIRKDGESNE